MDYCPKYARQTIKALEDNMKENYYNIIAGKDFFNKRPKALFKKKQRLIIESH